jgi:predicted phage tail protein
MKILIRLEGKLKKLYPEGVEVFARTGREALGMLSRFPGFRAEDGVKYFVRVDPLHYYHDLDNPLSSDVLTVTPVHGGAGGGSARQIVIGALLIGFALIAPGITIEGVALLAEGSILPSLAFNLGVSLVLGGILQHMSKAPKADPVSGDKRSRFLGSTQNTVASGTRIPLAYGRVKLGGHFLSFDVDAEDYVPE